MIQCVGIFVNLVICLFHMTKFFSDLLLSIVYAFGKAWQGLASVFIITKAFSHINIDMKSKAKQGIEKEKNG